MPEHCPCVRLLKQRSHIGRVGPCVHMIWITRAMFRVYDWAGPTASSGDSHRRRQRDFGRGGRTRPIAGQAPRSTTRRLDSDEMLCRSSSGPAETGEKFRQTIVRGTFQGYMARVDAAPPRRPALPMSQYRHRPRFDQTGRPTPPIASTATARVRHGPFFAQRRGLQALRLARLRRRELIICPSRSAIV